MMRSNDIEEAYDILKTYNGENNQILYYKYQHNNHKIILKEFDVNYILNNCDFEIQTVNKVVKITNDLGKRLQEKYEIDFTPEKILITKIIGEMGNSYHCYVQYRKSIPPILMYINKRDILNELNTVDYKDININFDYYDSITSNIGRKLKQHQKDGIKFLVANKKCILADTMGMGKQQPNDTVIPTPYGNKLLGDIKIGDKVFGSDGKPHNVLGVFPQGIQDVYEITFSDNSKTECGKEHLWIVRNGSMRARKKGWVVKTLGELMEMGIHIGKKSTSKKTFKPINKWEIPIAEACEYEEKKYFIDPYLLGVCIGDGNMCNGGINISIPDKEIETVERINNLLIENYKLKEDRSASCPRYRIKKPIYEKTNRYYQEIKRLGLNIHGNYKFIPQEYMEGSIKQRTELLQGLMDSDGYITPNKNKISYSTNSLKLANDVKILVESLGGKGVIHTYNHLNKGIEYVVLIQIKICPFKLERKKIRYTINDENHNTRNKYLIRKIKDVKLIGKKECTCIKVDSDDESYLTNDYIVTHNTTQLTVAALASESKKILVICPASLKTNWKNEICFYENEENVNIINGSEWGNIKKWTIVNYDILPNFYELPVEPVYEYRELPNSDGTVERLKVPVMTKSKSNGKMVPKTKKTIKKNIIKKCLENSKLYLEQFDCVIIDEAHKLSNNTSNRYKILEDYLKRSNPNYIFLTTGTPLTNKPINLFYILKLLSADITNDYRYFIKRYCGAKTFKLKDGREITTTGGATNLNELREKIKHLYIRRLLSDMSDMVEKNIVTKYYDLSGEQLNTYHKLWNEYLDSQQEQGKEDTEDYRQLVEGIIVRQFLAKEMVNNTIELADSIIEEDEKVVIICTFQEEMDAFMRYYKDKAVLFNGKMTLKQKDKSVSEFMNNPKVMVFIGQVESMVGITLTSANKLIFNSYSWIAASNAQAEDRIFRLNQDKDVTCVYQVFNDEISRHMFNTVQGKEFMAQEVIKKENEK